MNIDLLKKDILYRKVEILKQKNIRYLLLIAYMMGLAIGIHILNLLTMSFIGLIIYLLPGAKIGPD